MCKRDVALNPSGTIRWHKDRTGRSRLAHACDAAGKLTGEDARRAEMELLAELVAKYPEHAGELVAQLAR